MKKLFIALFLACTLVFVPGTLLSDMDVLCCRPLCEGCGAGDRMCEMLQPEMCRDLGGWPVKECEHCYQF